MSLPVEERKRPAESPALDERDVKKIIQTVREAASPATSATLDDSSDYLLPVEGPQPKQKDDGTRQGDRDPGWEDFASHYWDASTMAPLSAVSASKEQDEKSREPYNRRNLDGTGLSCGNNMNNLLMMRSKAAIARLRAFKPPPFPLWDRLPVSRRAAVLMLLYADRRGDLRVVITMRAASLRSFSGHAALPGGKADSLDETPFQIARREAWEEIGLPMDDSKIPAPFRIEHLCYLPHNLARTELVVRPCVAFLHTTAPPVPTAGAAAATASAPTVEESLMPRLDAKEVAAVFSAPFHNFLRAEDELPPPGTEEEDGASGGGRSLVRRPSLPPGKWYEGNWTQWHDEPWRVHFFYVPVHEQRVVRPRAPRRARAPPVDQGPLAGGSGDEGTNGPSAAGTREIAVDHDEVEAEESSQDDDAVATTGRFKVWGMTARIIVDAATVAYDETPEFEHNSHFGDERIIEALAAMGRLGEKKDHGTLLTKEDMKKASETAAKM